MARINTHHNQVVSISNTYKIIILIAIINFTFYSQVDGSKDDFSITNFDSFVHDYAPPTPPLPPPTPLPPSLSCEGDLKGVGSLNTTCQLNTNLQFQNDVNIEGTGNLEILPGVSISCLTNGCRIYINVSREFSLGQNSLIMAGTFVLSAANANICNGSLINTVGLAGKPPPQTSGTPQGLEGAGGGHGGRGASGCLGGDTYGWSALDKPWSYGSKGGTTSRETDFGGDGGGRIEIVVKGFLEVNGSILAKGGDGGHQGGGGSGGSIKILAHKMISASGGNGLAGGGGGRVAVNVYSRHNEPEILVHGGRSYGCPENSGAAGTLYDAVLQSLFICNHNMSTQTDTLLLEFPNQPRWRNVYVHDHARAAVPLLWSRVQIRGQLSILRGGVLVFGLAHYSYSEFELVADELLMSNSKIEVFGALRMSVKVLLMWKSEMLIDGVHGQGLLNLTGPGDLIEAQRLIISLFYSINLGPGTVLRGPLENATANDITPRLYCGSQDCPVELLHPPEDCNVNSSLPFTLQICRVEDLSVEGLIKGSVIHVHWVRAVVVQPSGEISASGMGCTGGVGRGNVLSNGVSGGGGHGGKGGDGYSDGTFATGGVAYGNADLPCELGSGSGNASLSGSTSGGGIIVMGSLSHSLSSLSVYGLLRADGESSGENNRNQDYGNVSCSNRGLGGGSGGTVLLFLHTLALNDDAVLSSVGGHGSCDGGGGGGGGRVHFHWSDIPAGDEYQPLASVNGRIETNGGSGRDNGLDGESGTVTGKACPKGLFGSFCEACPTGTYKNVSGSDKSLCRQCPPFELPHRALYITVRGGVAETPCPYKCVSDRYHMPNCYTSVEELIYTFGGPWLFGLLLTGLLILLALVLSVARLKFFSADELPGPAPTQHGSQIDHSFPFLESLNEKFQLLREFVRSEYDHSCLRSCRSRALYEGLKMAATSDLILAYVDFFLGGDEKRSDLPPRLHERFPMCLAFGGDGSYMSPFSLHSDNVLTSLMSQVVPPTIWYRLIAGLNAHLRLVRRGNLRVSFVPILSWIENYANPALTIRGLRVDLAWFQVTACGYCQFGLVVYAVEEELDPPSSVESVYTASRNDLTSRVHLIQRDNSLNHLRSSKHISIGERISGGILDTLSLRMIEDKKNIFYPLSLILHNTKPVRHQDLVGLVISILLLADFSLVLLTLLQLYSISFLDLFLVLSILPVGILFPFPAGINALFSHGPRKSAGHARVYALWNITSLINVMVAFFCGYIHYKNQSSSSHPDFQPWNFNMDESGWWMFPTGLILCKCVQARLINWHVANLEIQDRSLYSNDPTLFWRS
ncbi:hypothetical protein MKW92_032960 [Papaver armeniacum]|nr:hypothetical protein MKW92_032960 [Papaver armeniacum]